MTYKLLSLIAFVLAGLFLPFSCGSYAALISVAVLLLIGALLHTIGRMRETRKPATLFDDSEWHKGL